MRGKAESPPEWFSYCLFSVHFHFIACLAEPDCLPARPFEWVNSVTAETHPRVSPPLLALPESHLLETTSIHKERINFGRN